jgi:hypothetical protein
MKRYPNITLEGNDKKNKCGLSQDGGSTIPIMWLKKKSKKDKLVVNLKKHLCRLKNQQANAYLLTTLKPNIFEDVNDIELSKF